MAKISPYVAALSSSNKQRYFEKLAGLGFSEDPYFYDLKKKTTKALKAKEETDSAGIGSTSSSTSTTVTEIHGWTDDVSVWPCVEFGSIYVYLIEQPGFTSQSLKAYKSLEAYNYFQSGWVQECWTKMSEAGFVIARAKVNRSQALTEKPHEAWVGIRKKDGNVECGHCTCMAGLGEVCSHVAAILFLLEAATRHEYNVTACTSKPCQWKQQPVKKVEGCRVTNIEFSKPKKHGKEIKTTTATNQLAIEDPTDLLNSLRECAPDAVIFTVTDPVHFPIIDPKYPSPLIHMYNEELKFNNEEELKVLIQKQFEQLEVTNSACSELEKHTRQQSKSALWRQHRIGRVTASIFHEAVHVKSDLPKSLLKKIMGYSKNLSTAATRWGLDCEEPALKKFISMEGPGHKNLKVQKSGFVINPDYPHMGCSPDSIISCDCCGDGVIEIKSPHSFKHSSPCCIDKPDYCLKAHQEGDCSGSLKKDHKYFYQIQGQMAICKRNYCYFLVYTLKHLHIEKVVFDSTFWKTMSQQLTTFYKTVVMPELLTRAVGNSM